MQKSFVDMQRSRGETMVLLHLNETIVAQRRRRRHGAPMGVLQRCQCQRKRNRASLLPSRCFTAKPGERWVHLQAGKHEEDGTFKGREVKDSSYLINGGGRMHDWERVLSLVIGGPILAQTPP
jgi:hypothetical protein